MKCKRVNGDVLVYQNTRGHVWVRPAVRVYGLCRVRLFLRMLSEQAKKANVPYMSETRSVCECVVHYQPGHSWSLLVIPGCARHVHTRVIYEHSTNKVNPRVFTRRRNCSGACLYGRSHMYIQRPAHDTPPLSHVPFPFSVVSLSLLAPPRPGCLRRRWRHACSIQSGNLLVGKRDQL